jgi:hypothetical protein
MLQEAVLRMHEEDSIDDLFDVAVRVTKETKDLIRLMLDLQGNDSGKVEAAGVRALLRELHSNFDTIDDELRGSVRLLELREAEAERRDPNVLHLHPKEEEPCRP